MHIHGFTLGYREFKPEPTSVLYVDEQKKLTGSSEIICREEVDITWVRVSHAMAHLTFKGLIVKKLDQHHDFYGLLASAKGLIDEAPGKVARWRIEPNSELSLHVVAWLEDHPTLGYAKTEYNRKYYTPISKQVWLDTPDAKAGEMFNIKNFPFDSRVGLKPKEHTATIVWKSSSSKEENAAAFAAYMELAKAEERVALDTGIQIHIDR